MTKTPIKAAIDFGLDNQVGYLMRLASQRHTAIFQAHTRHGLTPTQFSALVRVAEQGSCSQNHLGRLAAMDVATIKGVIDRLHQKGFTQAEPDPSDKRRTLISLSPRGAEVVEEMLQVGVEITARTLEPLSLSEQRTMIKLLRKLG